jgi:hypothetical protein
MADVTASVPARAQERARALAADLSPAGASTRAEAALAAATDARTRRALLRERQRLAAEIARAALHGAVVEACRPHSGPRVQAHPLDVVERRCCRDRSAGCLGVG